MKNIAIADDNFAHRMVLRGLLEELGYKVTAEGQNWAEAVMICGRHRPDAIILDIRMPVKSGIEAATEITALYQTPVILLSAHNDQETAELAAKAGVMAFLAKPVRQEELTPAIVLAISRAAEFNMLRAEADGLKGALSARKSIEKAKGILMERDNITENEAFSRIRQISMDKRRQMADIAEAIILAFEVSDR